MLHHPLRGEPPTSSAHWAVGKSRDPVTNAVTAILIQIGDAKGGQARVSYSIAEAAAFAGNMRQVLEFADRMPLDLESWGERVRIVILREDGLEMISAIDALTH